MADDFNFGRVDLDKGLNRILESLDNARKKLDNSSDDLGYIIGDNWDEGIEDSIERISASSLKLDIAFKNIAAKVRKQVQQLAGSINGKNTKINIDFSKIDLNEEKLKARVSDLLEVLQTGVSFDTTKSAKDLENLVKLYVKYEAQLQSLQSGLGGISDAKGRANNLKEQLVLAQNMRDIWKMFDDSDSLANPFSSMRTEIQRIEGSLGTLQGIADKMSTSTTGDFNQLAEALKEIADLIREIRDNFAPLTTALNTEGTAFSNMAKEGSASLDTLLDKLKELGSLMDSLNQKDFNVTNLITQKGNVSESVLSLREQAKNLLNVVNVLVDAQNEVYKTNHEVYQGALRGSQGTMGSNLWELQSFDPGELLKKITKSGSEAKLMEHIATLEYYKDIVLTIINEINKFAPNTIDTSILSTLSQQKKLNAPSGSVEENKESISTAGSLLQEVKSTNEQVEAELKVIREQIEQTFDLSTVDLKYANITTALDTIYQQFVELQTKIKALDLDVQVSGVVVNNTTPTNENADVNQNGGGATTDIDEATKSISNEGDAAAEATLKKEAFVEANKQVALSGSQTAEGIKEATDAIKKEGDVAEEAVETLKELATSPINSEKNLFGRMFDTSDVSIFTEQVQQFADEMANAKGLMLENVKVTTDDHYEVTGAQLKLVNQELGLVITETYRLDAANEEAEDSAKGLAFAYATIGQTNKNNQKDLSKSNSLLSSYSSHLKDLQATYKEEYNPVKAITNADDLQELEGALNKITNKISEFKDVSGQTIKVVTPEDRAEIAALIADYERLIKTLQNKTWVASSLRTKDASTLNAEFAQDLETFKAQIKNAGLEDAMKDTIQGLQDSLKTAFDKNSLTQWMNSFDLAKKKMQTLQVSERSNNQAEQELKRQLALQDKLYAAKKQLVKLDAQDVDRATAARKVEELQKEYNANVNLVEVKNRELQLEEELQKAATSRPKNYEKLMSQVGVLSTSGNMSPAFAQQLQQYKLLYDELDNMRRSLLANPQLGSDSGFVAQMKETSLEAGRAHRAIQNVVNEANKLSKIPEASILKTGSWDGVTETQQALRDFAENALAGKVNIEGFNAAGTQMTATLNTGAGAVEKITVALNQASGEIVAFKTSSNSISSLWKNVTSSISSGIKQLATMYLSLHDGIRYLRQGFEYVREIDSAMAELRKVTDETTATYDEFKKTASEAAQEVGTTMSAMISSAADWARLGYTIQEASDLAKNTSILMNISEFEDINKATDTLISSLQAYKAEGEDVASLSMEIIDAFNEVGNSYAISTADLADSLTRSSASLVAAGNTLSESIALTTAANSVLQDPAVVGTLLKTTAMRLRGTSAKEIAAAGEETDGLISSTSKLAAKIQELTSIDGTGGIKILTDSGAYKSTYDILLEISQVWDQISDINQAALLEIIAGKRAASGVAAILQNSELLEDVFESAENSAGSAMDELQVHLDSIEGKIQQLTSSVETMWDNFMNDEIVKFVVDLLNNVVKLVDQFGLLPTIASGFIGIKTFQNISSNNAIGQQSPLHKTISDSIYKGFSGIKGLFTKDKTEATPTAKTTASTATGVPTTMMGSFNAATQAVGTEVKNLLTPVSKSINTGANKMDTASTQMKSAAETMSTSVKSFSNAVARMQGQDVDVDVDSNDVDVDPIPQTPNVIQEASEDFVDDMDDVVDATMDAGTAMTFGQKAASGLASFGLSLAASAATALASILITQVINAIVEASQRMKEMKENAIIAADGLEANRNATEDYEEEIRKLRKTLASNTTSEEEAYDARSRLIGIQEELIGLFGDEAEGINLVTGAIDSEIEAIKKLNIAAAQKYVDDPGKFQAYEDAADNINKTVNLSSRRITGGMLDLEQYGEEFFNKAKELGIGTILNYYDNEIYDKQGNLSSVERIISEGYLDFSGTREEIAQQVDGLIEWARDYAEKHPDAEIDIDALLRILPTDVEIGLDDEEYQKDLEVYNKYLENKAIAEYTDVYGEALEEQDAYRKALTEGDLEAQKEHLNNLNQLYSEALAKAQADGDAAMVDYWKGKQEEIATDTQRIKLIEDIEAEVTFGRGGRNKKNLKQIAQQVKSLYSDQGMTVMDVVNMGTLIDNGGDISAYTEEQIKMWSVLTAVAEKYGFEVEDVLNTMSEIGYIKISPIDNTELQNAGKTVDLLSANVDKYNSAAAAMKEITYDNMQISEEYYTALTEYIGDTAELSEAIDTENGYIVTNSELLQELIEKKQKEQAADVKLSKAQARLRYYELYKEMRNLTKGNKKLTASEMKQLDALYDQMSGIEATIAQYSLLEAQLLGTTNAFNKLADAQAADEATDYRTEAEELVSVLANAFNTAELGSEAAKVAIAGLIPDGIIDKSKTLDEQMQQIYEYFTGGEISKLFTIEFDDDGGISSVEMTKENIEGYAKELIDRGIFTGTWDEFDLSPGITTLKDFAEQCGLTEEAAFAFLTSLEKYDISWLGGDNETLLDKLMGDNFDYKLQKATKAAADAEKKLASGELSAGDKEYKDTQAELESLEEEAIDKTVEWSRTQQAIEEEKNELIRLQKEYDEAVKAEDSDIVKELNEEISKQTEIIDTHVDKLEELGDAPSEFVLEVASEEAQENIDEFKEELHYLVTKGSGKAIKIQAFVDKIDETGLDGLEELGFSKGEDGVWRGTAKIEGWSELDEESKKKVLDYINMVQGQHDIDFLLGEGTKTTEDYFNQIVGILEKIAQLLDPNYKLEVETTEAESNLSSFKDMWDGIKDKTVNLITKIFGNGSGGEDSGGGGGSGHFVNGTAHARGTAFKKGSWGAPKTETALVGELGPEMVVRNGRWFTVGENGAEFTDIQKGDIIFNHKQTEDLLSKGYVIGRGKAYASGTAYAGINTFDDHYGSVHEDYKNQGEDNYDFSDMEDDVESLIDFIEIKLEEIEAHIAKTTAKLENYVDDTSQESNKSKQYESLIEDEREKKRVYGGAKDVYESKANTLLSKIPEEYRALAKSGGISVKGLGEDLSEKIDEYREWATKADEAAASELEAIARIEELRLEQFNDLADDYDNLTSRVESETSLIEAKMDLEEESGRRLSTKYYDELIKNTNETMKTLENKRAQMQKNLDDAVRSGDVKKGSDAWYEMVNAINDVDVEIVECQTSIEEYQNAINDLKWDNFDKLIDKLDDIDSELSHVYDRLTDTEDVTDKDGVWSNKSIAALGVSAQRMELAQKRAEEYAQAIKDLNKDYKAGKYSTDEYNEKLAELKEGQWESIEAYEDEKDAIMDLNKARIDTIKDGIEEEIDAYKELIDKKKEALDADKDLYDFEKNVAKQQKEISKLERQIAALSGDNSLSATAKRKQLEAELLEAKAELEDIYYDRSIENQKNALDKEAETFEENKNSEVESLEEWLKDEEAVISESLNTVKSNTDVVLKEINAIAAQYGVDISNSLTDPWTKGSNAIDGYKNKFSELSSFFADEVDEIIKELERLQQEADRVADEAVKKAKDKISDTESAQKDSSSNSKPSEKDDSSDGDPGAVSGIDGNLKKGSKGEDVKALQDSLKALGYDCGATDGIYGSKTEAAVKQYQKDQKIASDGIVGPKTKKEFGKDGYAKGTLGVKDDDWAWIDEVGEELVLHADGSGRLSYLTKGTSVIPADLTEKLMKLAADPTQTLENSRPIISAPHIVNNEITISMDVSEVVHIDTVTNDTIPDLTKAIEKQMDKYMKQVNSQIRKYSR